MISLSPSYITTHTIANLVTFQEAGVLEGSHLNSRASLLGSMSIMLSVSPRVFIDFTQPPHTRGTLRAGNTFDVSNSNPQTFRGNHQPIPVAALRTMPGIEYDAMRPRRLNPSHALQHSGFYYYVAARCTEMRRSRLLSTLNGDVGAHYFCYAVILTRSIAEPQTDCSFTRLHEREG